MGNLRYDFSGRTVIVTGAARGIGLELGRIFHTAGAEVVLVDCDDEQLAKAAADIGAHGVVADVGESADVERAVSYAIRETGRVDILVNNAGVLRDRVLWK